jgi:hypothetical protein
MKFRSNIGNYLNSLRLLGQGVEIGVHTGIFSEQIMRHWKGRKLWLIDPWRHLDEYLDNCNTSDQRMEHRLELARQRLHKWQPRIGWIRATSELAANLFKQDSCDFVYIDANHSYQHVRQDLELWYSKLRVGGLFSGHDYFDALTDEKLNPVFSAERVPREKLVSYGVKSAVDEFAKEIGVSVLYTSDKYPTWYFIKNDGPYKQASCTL